MKTPSAVERLSDSEDEAAFRALHAETDMTAKRQAARI